MYTKKNKYIILFVLSFIFIVSTVVGLTSINHKGFAQTKTPIVMTFDNQGIIKDLNTYYDEKTGQATTYDSNSWNSVETLENGYLHMKLRSETSSADGDGFQIAHQDLSRITGDFNLDEYKYMKVRFKRTEVANTRICIYIGSGDRTVYLNDASFNDVWTTMVFDLSVNDTNTTAVYYYNESTGTSGTARYSGRGTLSDIKGSPAYFRFAPARGTTTMKTADIEYISFFTTKEEADAYNGCADQKLLTAEQVLRTIDMTLTHSEGKDVENVKKSVKAVIDEKAAIGATVGNFSYTAPQIGVDGALNYEVTLVSGGKSKTVTGLKVVIKAIPEDPVIVRFNDQSVLDKFSSKGDCTFTIEDGVLKMVKNNPITEDLFYMEFFSNDLLGQSFRQQDYSFVKIKYKQMQGGGSYQVYYTKDATNYRGSITYLLNWDVDQWQEIIIDMNGGEKAVEIYNTETGEISYQHIYNSSTWKPMTASDRFYGDSNHFRFTFGRRNNYERTSYIEYIAFFPTLEQAQNYEDDWEKVKADAKTSVKEENYIVKNALGKTEELALSSAKSLIGDTIGKYFDIEIRKNSYIKPTDVDAGSLNFDVIVKYDKLNEQVVIENVTMQIMSATGKTAIVNTLEGITASSFEAGYYDFADLTKAKESAKTLLSKNLPNGVFVKELNNFTYTASSATEKGEISFDAVLTVDDDGTMVERTVQGYSIATDTIPAKYSEIVFDQNKSVSTLSNAEISRVDGRLFVKTKNASTEDQFSIIFNGDEEIRLEDYPYVKIRYNKTGFANNSGQSTLYFQSATQSIPNRLYECTFYLGDKAYMDKEMFAILDMRNGQIMIYDTETNKLVSTSTFYNTNGSYSGKVSKYWFNLARHITVERTIYLDYITFCSTLEDAIEYNGDSVKSACHFDGSDYLVSEKDVSSFKKLEASVKVNSVKDLGLIAGTNSFGIYVNANGALVYKNSNGTLTADNVNLISGRWQKVMATAEGQAVKLYVDGKLVKEGTVSEDLSVGKLYVGGMSSTQNNLLGYVCDVKVYNSLSNQTPDLAWTIAKRSSDNKYFSTGTIENSLIYKDVYGHLYHEFLGADNVKVQKSLTNAPLTVETWIKTTQANADAVLMDNGAIKVIIKQDGNVQLIIGGNTLTTENLKVNNGQWTHIAFTKDVAGGKVALYVNGALQKEWTGLTLTASETEKTAFTFGSDINNSNYYIGYIGETRLWSTIRTANMIAENKGAYYSGDTTNLISLWKFEYSNNLVYADLIGNNGAKINSKTWYKTNLEDFDYTLVVIPDTQDQVLLNPEVSKQVANYVVENKQELNIIGAFAMGDHTQNNTPMEWEWIYEAFSVFEDQILYMPVIGNHDYPSLSGKGSEIRDGEMFNKYWSYEFLSKQEGFGGVFEEGRTDNYYVYMTDGKVEYIVIATEFAPRDEVLEWVNIVLKNNADKKAIIITHCGLKADGTIVGQDGKPSNAGYGFVNGTTCTEMYDLWLRVVKRNENVTYVIGGHVGGIGFDQYENDFGEKVSFVVCDGSQVPSMPSGLGLTGFVRYNDDGSSIYYIYSPTYDAYYRSDYFWSYQANI